ncbi:MAG: hypothetical protein GW947_04020 [Candidatus Pacebacteria bacterium]|nr:hypothetical protein [Candidatus Paceibacterota bacterium]
MNKPKKLESVFVVIPTIRDLEFLNDWGEQFRDITLIVCEDRPTKSVNIPKVAKKTYHYSWKEIDADLGKDSWIIPRKVSAIRNYGFLQAYKKGATIIITLDDDCYPVVGHDLIDLHVQNLSLSTPANWVNTNPDSRHLYTRGMPYLNREEQPVMLSHGLWTNVLDHDGPTHLRHLSFRAEFAEHFSQIIPNGAYFPMCSMNLAFRSEITPLMYFPLMGEDSKGNKWGYDRFDDIWAGIFAKKILDHVGYGTINGAPFIEHRKASDPFANLKKEASGIEQNERIWKDIQSITLSKTKNIANLYAELAAKLDTFADKKYFSALKEAMGIWAKLF